MIAAVSGRALAQAARRAGYRARVADFFCDDDTAEAAEQVVALPGDLQSGIDAERLVETLRALVEGSNVTMDNASTRSAVVHSDFRPPTPPPSAVPLPRKRRAIAYGDLTHPTRLAEPVLGIAEGNIRGLGTLPVEGRGTAEGGGGGAHVGGGGMALILGSGFERLPGLVDEVSDHFLLAGNAAATIARVKDPERLAQDCLDLGIPHPELRWQEPTDPASWLIKSAGGAGGAHVRPANHNRPASGRYFQRRIDGGSISTLFVADRRAAHLVGFSRQWTSPTPHAPYRYGGAVRLRRFPRKEAAQIAVWLSLITARLGLVGLCSADLIRNRSGYTLIEINPRPGATLDIFDSEDAPLIEAHLCACRGEPFTLPRFDDSMASMIAYAETAVPAFPRMHWPDWTADHQPAGTNLQAGDPVCTIFARGKNADEARRDTARRLKQLERAWAGGRE